MDGRMVILPRDKLLPRYKPFEGQRYQTKMSAFPSRVTKCRQLSLKDGKVWRRKKGTRVAEIPIAFNDVSNQHAVARSLEGELIPPHFQSFEYPTSRLETTIMWTLLDIRNYGLEQRTNKPQRTSQVDS